MNVANAQYASAARYVSRLRVRLEQRRRTAHSQMKAKGTKMARGERVSASDLDELELACNERLEDEDVDPSAQPRLPRAKLTEIMGLALMSSLAFMSALMLVGVIVVGALELSRAPARLETNTALNQSVALPSVAENAASGTQLPPEPKPPPMPPQISPPQPSQPSWSPPPPPPPPHEVLNLGSDCWGPCHSRGGACTGHCGLSGACCRLGPEWEDMPECGFGTKGCREKHCCIAAASAPPPLPLLPPLPPAMPTSPSASPLRLAEHVSAINRRFRRSPHDIQWAFDGSLADAAVLVHIFDRWEYHDNDGYQYWRADLAHRPQLSCSLIYAEQRPAISPNIPIPVYGNGVGSNGVVLRPGRTTRIACGTGWDSGGGACRQRCPSIAATGGDPSHYDPQRDGRDGCSWGPQDFGVYLKRANRWQTTVQARGRNTDYNEVVVEGDHWNAHLPLTIEAFFGDSLARTTRDQFLTRYNLNAVDVPLLSFDVYNWEQPFAQVRD